MFPSASVDIAAAAVATCCSLPATFRLFGAMTSTVVEIRDGFIKDEFAKQCEPYQRPYEFLYTGRLPEVGQRTETQITSLNGNWCRLSGIVTEVGELPTFDMWVTVSFYFSRVAAIYLIFLPV